MDFYLLYTVIKYVHVLGAIAWIGGGVTLCFLSILAVRANGPMTRHGGAARRSRSSVSPR